MNRMKSLKSLTVCAAFAAITLSCSSHKDIVPYEEFCSVVDSISQANNVKMFVEPNQYKTFGLRREDFDNTKRRLAKYKDSLTVYVLEMGVTRSLLVNYRPGRDTLEHVIARYWATEEQRKHRKNRISWREYRDSIYKVNPDVGLVPKNTWKKRRMLRSELHADMMSARPLKPQTYIMEKGADGKYRTTRRVTDSVELAKIKARRYRWNSVANGMLGSAHNKNPYIGLVFGAEDYRLSDTERLWLKVYAGHCHPFPKAKPTCEVQDYNTYVVVKDSTGREDRVYIKVRDPRFRLLQNPPFRYTFTANFEYNGRWYYVFMCENPLRCVCRPIDVPQKDFPA